MAAPAKETIWSTFRSGVYPVLPTVEPSTVTLGPGQDGVLTLRVTVNPAVAATEVDSEGFVSVSDGRMTIPEILYVPYWIRTAPLTPAEPFLRAINARGK